MKSAPPETPPWFADASIRQLTQIERPAPDHLRWPALDVDLELDSLLHPEKYPLVSRALPSRHSLVSEPPRPSRRSDKLGGLPKRRSKL